MDFYPRVEVHRLERIRRSVPLLWAGIFLRKPATVSNVGLGILKPSVTVSAKFASAVAECTAPTGYAPLTAAGLTSAAVPKTASTVLCFQVSLDASTSVLLKGQAVNISLPLTARPLCGVPGDRAPGCGRDGSLCAVGAVDHRH
jgi:hypothetical protein